MHTRVHNTLPVLRLGVEAALSWPQLPQQDVDNIEKKPKVHLEIEVWGSERQESGVALVAWLGPLWDLETPNP